VPPLKELAGIDRGCFSPYLAGTAAWLLAKGTSPTPSELGRLTSVHFAAHLVPDYAERFGSHTPPTPTKRQGAATERDAMLEQAFLEAKSALRRVVVGTSPVGAFGDDSDFDSDPTYSKGSTELDGIELELTSLDEFDLSRCPQCGLVGEVDAWFGWRTMSGREVRQSWCRICRAGKPRTSH
jgi:hypothetical protein